MPFKHKRKTNRCFRSSLDVLKRAAKCVTEEGSSYREAAANFNVDKMTLIRYISSVQFSFLLFLLRHMNKITKC